MLKEISKANQIPSSNILLEMVLFIEKADTVVYSDCAKLFNDSRRISLAAFDHGMIFLRYLGIININRSKYISVVDGISSVSRENLLVKLIRILKKSKLYTSVFGEGVLTISSDNSLALISYLIPHNLHTVIIWMLRENLLSHHPINKDILVLHSDFSSVVNMEISKINSSPANVRKFTQVSLDAKLLRQRQIGNEGELFVCRYERQRLIGHKYLSNVSQISLDYVSAGYDIQSYNDKGSVYIDRYIEVKTYSGNREFYWSENEIQVAIDNPLKYKIYLVDYQKVTDVNYEPEVISNPADEIFNSGKWKVSCQSFKVSEA